MLSGEHKSGLMQSNVRFELRRIGSGYARRGNLDRKNPSDGGSRSPSKSPKIKEGKEKEEPKDKSPKWT
jgi:hypothetical protein